jgi:hypothetical protein
MHMYVCGDLKPHNPKNGGIPTKVARYAIYVGCKRSNWWILVMMTFMPRPPLPGGAVFEPRSFAENRKKFGRTSSRLTAGAIKSPQHAAAEVQHAIANTIREYLLDENTDLKAYCEKPTLPAGLTYERFQRINRGETMITLTDVMYWSDKIPGFATFIGKTMDAVVTPEASIQAGPPAEASPSERP